MEKKKKEIIGLICTILLSMGLLIWFVGGDIRGHLNEQRLMEEGNITTATIVQVLRDRAVGRYERGSGAIILLEYEVDGVVYRIRRNVLERDENRVGERLEIYYDYRNPGNFILVNRDRDFSSFTPMTVIFSVGFGLALFLCIKGLIKALKE